MRYYRKVIRIRATDSPNVRLGLEQMARGVHPTGHTIVPGVLGWDEYVTRRATWDKIRQCIGLDAEFYAGAELLLFPPEWLGRARQYAQALRGRSRQAKAIGIDPAEGGDKTSMAAIDELGLIELVSRQTPDTDVIPREALAFMQKHNVPPERVVFDRGGGGKQAADYLRARGCQVRTVAFGESLMLDPKRGLTQLEVKLDNREERYAYVNRRAEMYHALSLLVDPSRDPLAFGLPEQHCELFKQLSPIPKEYDEEGRLKLRPKNRKPGQEETRHKTLVELIGHSPDEADALVLAVHGMLHKVHRSVAGVA